MKSEKVSEKGRQNKTGRKIKRESINRTVCVQ